MSNGYGLNPLAAGQIASGSNLAAAIATAMPPSLEDRWHHLARGCERLAKLRTRLANDIDRVQVQPSKPPSDLRSRPEPSGLSDRFGDAIGYVHDSCDELEYLAMRLEELLFGQQAVEAQQANRA